jgi:hypothetical protein
MICTICQEEIAAGRNQCFDPYTNEEGIHCGARACVLACEVCQEMADVVVECAPPDPKKEEVFNGRITVQLTPEQRDVANEAGIKMQAKYAKDGRPFLKNVHPADSGIRGVKGEAGCKIHCGFPPDFEAIRKGGDGDWGDMKYPGGTASVKTCTKNYWEMYFGLNDARKFHDVIGVLAVIHPSQENWPAKDIDKIDLLGWFTRETWEREKESWPGVSYGTAHRLPNRKMNDIRGLREFVNRGRKK